jgi:hypothetical protein
MLHAAAKQHAISDDGADGEKVTVSINKNG